MLKTFVLLMLLASSCKIPKFSPWQTDLPRSMQDSTNKNLALLMQDKEKDNTSQSFRFAIIGDPQGTPGDFKSIVKNINNIPDVKFIVVLGDLTDFGLKHEYEWAFEALEESRVPYFTAIGNHDAISHGKNLYSKMFGVFDYTFNYGGKKFVVWNNNKKEFNKNNFDWLSSQIDENSIVLSHIPPLLDVHTGMEVEAWLGLYERAKPLASLHGHRGTHEAYKWQEGETDVYVVAKAVGGNYALITVGVDNKIGIEPCVKVCGSLL